MAYTVSQRVAEIGVRMAIGASPATWSAMVVRQGAMLAAAGVALGLVGAAAAARAVQSLLFVDARVSIPLTFARQRADPGRGGAAGELHSGPPRRARLAGHRARPVTLGQLALW